MSQTLKFCELFAGRFVLLVVFVGIVIPGFGKSKTQSIAVDFTKDQVAEQQTNLLRTSDGISVFRQNDPAFFLAQPQSIPIADASPFLTIAPSAYIQNFDPSIISLQIRYSEDGVLWSDWDVVERFHDAEIIGPHFIGELMYVDTAVQFFQYMVLFDNNTQSLSPVKVKNLNFDFFSPGQVQEPTQGTLTYQPRPANEQILCGCPQPGFATRTDWSCPDGQSPSCASPEITTPSHMIIHHSAGSNSSNGWAAVVLSIWNFHVNTNGWCDIGYNWLIDPNGIIYEGRGGGNNVKGAHFCGANSGTVGICVLGNFENAPPTPEALASLRSLLTWKSCDAALDPLGTDFHASSGKSIEVISGHRNGCATQCPGDAFHPMFGMIRMQVDTALKACNGVNSIESEATLPGLSLFPNPANDQLFVSWDQSTLVEGNVQLYSLQGQALLQREEQFLPGRPNVVISTEEIPDGVYLLQVGVGEAILRKRIVVRH